jgi:hypothetical protein
MFVPGGKGPRANHFERGMGLAQPTYQPFCMISLQWHVMPHGILGSDWLTIFSWVADWYRAVHDTACEGEQTKQVELNTFQISVLHLVSKSPQNK